MRYLQSKAIVPASLIWIACIQACSSEKTMPAGPPIPPMISPIKFVQYEWWLTGEADYGIVGWAFEDTNGDRLSLMHVTTADHHVPRGLYIVKSLSTKDSAGANLTNIDSVPIPSVASERIAEIVEPILKPYAVGHWKEEEWVSKLHKKYPDDEKLVNDIRKLVSLMITLKGSDYYPRKES